jgi:hypothetical protein
MDEGGVSAHVFEERGCNEEELASFECKYRCKAYY